MLCTVFRTFSKFEIVRPVLSRRRQESGLRSTSWEGTTRRFQGARLLAHARELVCGDGTDVGGTLLRVGLGRGCPGAPPGGTLRLGGESGAAHSPATR